MIIRSAEIPTMSRTDLVQILNDEGIIFEDELSDDELRELIIVNVLEEPEADEDDYPDEYFR